MLPGFAINLVVATIIIGFIYYPANRSKKDYVFTFFTFNILIFFISGLLRDVQLTIGFGFGLLAVFSTLRYRTEQIRVKDMTYLFISITIPFMISLFMATRITYQELIIVNTAVVLAVLVLEKGWGINYELEKEVLYEQIDLVKPANHHLLLEDLRQRTGIDVKRFEVQNIDFLRDTARLTIYYDNPKRAGANGRASANRAGGD